jgi:hypothetical protein
MVTHTFIIITADKEAATEIAAVADKYEGRIDIDYEVVNHIRKKRTESNE